MFLFVAAAGLLLRPAYGNTTPLGMKAQLLPFFPYSVFTLPPFFFFPGRFVI